MRREGSVAVQEMKQEAIVNAHNRFDMISSATCMQKNVLRTVAINMDI